MKPKTQEQMKIYTVEYELDGITKTDKVEGCDPGHAFAKCIKDNPGVKMLRAIISSQVCHREFWIEYEAPKVQRDPMPEVKPARALRKNERGCEFPFYDEVQSVRAQ